MDALKVVRLFSVAKRLYINTKMKTKLLLGKQLANKK